MKTLNNCKVGDTVWCGGDSGFCDSSFEKIKKIEKRYNSITGKPYKIFVLSGNRKFNGITGFAINSPTAYRIELRIKGE